MALMGKDASQRDAEPGSGSAGPGPLHWEGTRQVVEGAAWIVISIAAIWSLRVGEAFLVPAVLAIFAFAVLNALDRFWRRQRLFARAMPEWLRGTLSLGLSTLLIAAIVALVSFVVADNAAQVAEKAPEYNDRLLARYDAAKSWLGERGIPIGDTTPQDEAPDPDVTDPAALPTGEGDREEPAPELGLIERIDFARLVRSVAGGMAETLGNGALVVIYVFFLLLERKVFPAKLRAIFGDGRRRADVSRVLEQISHDVGVYLGMKTLVSALTAVPAYIIMRVIGLDFAEFWALLIFILNFIPNIGSLVATALPTLLALLQFDGLREFWIVGIGVTAIQLFVANVVEPHLMSRSLNMSPLVVIVALVAWSLLWGVAGAFLCVPMTVVLLIVLSNFESTRWVAVLLSRDGTVGGDARTKAKPAAGA